MHYSSKTCVKLHHTITRSMKSFQLPFNLNEHQANMLLRLWHCIIIFHPATTTATTVTFIFHLTGIFFWTLLQVRPGPPQVSFDNCWCKIFLHERCPSHHPTNGVKAVKENDIMLTLSLSVLMAIFQVDLG